MNRSVGLRMLGSVALLAVLTVNVLANALPINGLNTGEVSDLYPSLFTPAGITFSIWSVIYLSLIGFLVYAWMHGREAWIDRILPWFALTGVFNISWILVWHFLLPGTSVLIMFMLLVTLLKIFLIIREMPLKNWKENLFVSLPFTLYLAWICVATIANISAFLISIDWTGGAINAEVWTICMMTVSAMLATKVVFDYGTPAFILVVMWALLGIYLRWNDSPYDSIGTAALILEVFLTGVLIVTTTRRKRI